MTSLLIGIFLLALAIVMLLWYCGLTSGIVVDAMTDESHMDTEGHDHE